MFPCISSWGAGPAFSKVQSCGWRVAQAFDFTSNDHQGGCPVLRVVGEGREPQTSTKVCQTLSGIHSTYPPLQRTQGWGTLSENNACRKSSGVGHPSAADVGDRSAVTELPPRPYRLFAVVCKAVADCVAPYIAGHNSRQALEICPGMRARVSFLRRHPTATHSQRVDPFYDNTARYVRPGERRIHVLPQ